MHFRDAVTLHFSFSFSFSFSFFLLSSFCILKPDGHHKDVYVPYVSYPSRARLRSPKEGAKCKSMKQAGAHVEACVRYEYLMQARTLVGRCRWPWPVVVVGCKL